MIGVCRLISPRLILPWPPASLSGHANGNGRWSKIADTKRCRELAYDAGHGLNVAIPETGDVLIKFRFEPPNRRADRVNYPNRLKPYIDGIADAIGINDSRFLPSYEFGEIFPSGRIIIMIGAE